MIIWKSTARNLEPPDFLIWLYALLAPPDCGLNSDVLFYQFLRVNCSKIELWVGIENIAFHCPIPFLFCLRIISMWWSYSDSPSGHSGWCRFEFLMLLIWCLFSCTLWVLFWNECACYLPYYNATIKFMIITWIELFWFQYMTIWMMFICISHLNFPLKFQVSVSQIMLLYGDSWDDAFDDNKLRHWQFIFFSSSPT